MKRSSKIVLAVLGVLLSIVLVGLGVVYHVANHVVPESYAAWSSGEILVHYMATHSNAWPRSWDDIAEATDSLLAERKDDVKWGIYTGRGLLTTNRTCVLSELQRWVKIDWSADPAKMAGRPTLVSRPNGKPFRMILEDPNDMVHDHLIEKKGPSNNQIQRTR